MEEIVYSNIQAKPCTGSCTYRCTDLVWTKNTDTCSSDCSCNESLSGLVVGDSCDPNYDPPFTTDCI